MKDYSIHPVGFVDLTTEGKNFITDCRKALKGTGWTLWARGRNPNRRQHEGKSNGYLNNTYSGNGLRQSIPLTLSTYAGLYIRPIQLEDQMTSERVKGMLDTIRKIYNTHNIKINTVRS